MNSGTTMAFIKYTHIYTQTQMHFNLQSERSKQIKIKVEIKNKKSIKKINETKICFFETINKMDKPLTRLRKK